MSFAQAQIERVRPLWDRMLEHPFLSRTRDGEIGHETFANWMRQDYLFVEAAIPFIAAMLPKAPRRHWEAHTGVIGMLQKELELFRDRAEAAGVDMEGIEPSFTCHAYIQFLMATAHTASYPEVFTVFYAAEKCYHDSWKVVKAGLDPDSVWYPFVENWAGHDFAEYVAFLGSELDTLADGAGADQRERMAHLFETTVKYEIAFWEMAFEGAAWPGL